MGPHHYPQRRCRRNISVEHLSPTSGERAANDLREHRAARTAVATDDDRPRLERTGKRGDIARGDRGRQALAYDSPQPGNADNRFAHAILRENPISTTRLRPNIPRTTEKTEWKLAISSSGKQD